MALLNVTYKVFSNCILSRLKETSENIIGDYQRGFRLGRSTSDQIFILRQIFQNTWAFDKESMFFLLISGRHIIVFIERV